MKSQDALVIASLASLSACQATRLQTVVLPEDALEQDLVAHWSFDETGGATLHDSSGNGHHGAITGGAWTTGRFGGALSFARGDSVEIATFPDATPSWTVSAWSYIPGPDLTGYGLIALVTAELGLEGGWELNLMDRVDDRHYHFGYYVGAGDGSYVYEYYNFPFLVTDQWVQLSAVVDAQAMSLTFYVDGYPVQRAPIHDLIKPGTKNLTMARWRTDERLYAGMIDDVAIWSRALNGAEIALLHHLPAPEPVPQPRDDRDGGTDGGTDGG